MGDGLKRVFAAAKATRKPKEPATVRKVPMVLRETDWHLMLGILARFSVGGLSSSTPEEQKAVAKAIQRIGEFRT
jgi:hypothetical protein